MSFLDIIQNGMNDAVRQAADAIEDAVRHAGNSGSGLPPEIDRNNRRMDQMDRETNRLMERQAAENAAETEKLFYVQMALREQGKVAESMGDSFVKFVETREERRLNDLATQNQLDLPHPETEGEWDSFASELERRRERQQETVDRVGGLLEGELPQEANQAQDAMNRARQRMPRSEVS